MFLPLTGKVRFKGAYGGRGSGKSHFFAESLVEKALLQPGMHAVCIREVQKSLAQSSKRTIELKIQALGLGKLFDVQDKAIRTPGGGLIIFQGMQNHTQESIKSLEGYDVAWVDEAQSLSQSSIDMLYPTIRKPGSEMWFSWNPSQPKDPVDVFFRGENVKDPDFVSVRANFSQNPWFRETALLRDMQRDKRDPDRYAHIWLGEYQRHSEARVFRNWKIEEFQTPVDARFYYGADWGFSVDPTVLVRCFIQGRTLYVDQEAWQVGCEIDRTPALFDRIDDGHARRWPIMADSANPQSISYMARHGFPKIAASVKGPGSVEEGVEFLKSYDIEVHPRCKHVIDELTLYAYEVDKQTGDVLPKLADRKNHTIDSLRYAVEGVRRAHPVAVYGTYGQTG